MSIHIAPRPAPRPAPVAKAEAAIYSKAGPVGPGAGVLNTEYPLDRYAANNSPQKKMQRAWALSFAVPWIAAAEDAITERMANVDWDLEDENDEEIDDQYPNEAAQRAKTLLEKPSSNLTVGAPYYQSDLWGLTGRAMGVCGSGFIFLDMLDAYANTPSAMLPIAPWRMYPEEDDNGNLIGWSIDKTRTDPGIAVRMDEILHYRLRPGYVGHFGIGLVESALTKAQLSQGLDNHLAMVIEAGGRLSGFLSPKTGVMGSDQMLQAERDWRTVVEQSDAAKRLQLMAAPVDFTPTTLTPAEMQIRDLMDGARDDLLTLWGVPLSIIGGTTPAGLNSGDTRKYDEAAIWQGPVHHRLNIFRQVTQYQLLDRWQALGVTVELEIEEPEFDDDSPRYDLLGKSLNSPLTNLERRALIGLPPTGDPSIDNAILLPATIVPYAQAPDQEGNVATPTEEVLGRTPENDTSGQQSAASAAAGETSSGPAAMAPQAGAAKAVLPSRLSPRVAPLHASLVRYREHAMSKYTPLLKNTVGDVLKEQQHDIAERLRKHAAHVEKHPGDSSIWWSKTWDAKLHHALAPRLEAVSQVVAAGVHDVLPPLPAKAAAINEVTRAKVEDGIARGLERGLSVAAVADLIEGLGSEEAAAALGIDAFADERAETIAKSEMDDALTADELVAGDEGKADDGAIAQAIMGFATAHSEGMAAMRAVHEATMETVTSGLADLGGRIGTLAETPHNVQVSVAAPIVNLPPVEPPTVIIPPARNRTVKKNRDGSYSVTED
jgi:phage portal protein BeeE